MTIQAKTAPILQEASEEQQTTPVLPVIPAIHTVLPADTPLQSFPSHPGIQTGSQLHPVQSDSKALPHQQLPPPGPGTAHAPIDIDGDADFASQATAEGWPGSGTQSDPYVIEGYDIDRAGAAGHCISIKNTRVYFIVRQCQLTGASQTDYAGIYLYNVSNGQLVDNNCTSNYFGVYLEECSSCTVQGGLVEDSGNDGIYLKDCEECTVQDCSPRDNGDYGINIYYGSNCTILGCSPHNNSNYGIRFYYSDYVTVQDCDPYNNTKYGISLYGTSHGVIRNCDPYNNTLHGIRLQYFSSYCYIIDCSPHDNGEDGIHIYQSSSYVTLIRCSSYGNGEDGIHMYGAHYSSVERCNCTGNGEDGIHISETNYCTISNCSSTGNGGGGLHLYYGNWITVNGIAVSDNTRGVHLSLTVNCYLYASHISDNDYGLYVDQWCSTSITLCNVTGNTWGFNIGSGEDVSLWGNNFYGNGGYMDNRTVYLDNGVYGNYWDAYTGVDADLDLRGDTPHQLDADSQDRYPLVIPAEALSVDTPVGLVRNWTVTTGGCYFYTAIVAGTPSKVLLTYMNAGTLHTAEMTPTPGKGTFQAVLSLPGGSNILYAVSVLADDSWYSTDWQGLTAPDTTPPQILNLWWMPEQPAEGQILTLCCQVTDDAELDQVLASYWDGAWHNLTMTYSDDLDCYTAVMPSYPRGFQILLRFYAGDTAGNWVASQIYTVTFQQPVQVEELMPWIGAGLTASTVALAIGLAAAIFLLRRKTPA